MSAPHPLHALLAAARAAAADPPDDTALAAFVVDRRLGGPPAPGAADEHARIEAAHGTDPAVARRAAAMERRLDALAADMEDPAARFARLTGRRLDEPPSPPVSS